MEVVTFFVVAAAENREQKEQNVYRRLMKLYGTRVSNVTWRKDMPPLKVIVGFQTSVTASSEAIKEDKNE